MFWPSIYQDIKHEISMCASCNALRPHQTKEPLQLHDMPDLPWDPYSSQRFWVGGGGGHLVLVDSYFGWFEIDQLPNMTSATIITRLKRHFFTHGAPQLLMTDNATYFPSREFQEFARIWDFCHITSSPWGRVNDDRIFIFGRTIPLITHHFIFTIN